MLGSKSSLDERDRDKTPENIGSTSESTFGRAERQIAIGWHCIKEACGLQGEPLAKKINCGTPDISAIVISRTLNDPDLLGGLYWLTIVAQLHLSIGLSHP
jgi:hypothetical protein